MDATTTSTRANNSLSYNNVDNTDEWDKAFINNIASQSKTDDTATQSDLNQSEVQALLTQKGIKDPEQQDAILSLFPTLKLGGAISVEDFIKKFDINNDDKIDGFEINNTLNTTSELGLGHDNLAQTTLNKEELQDFLTSITGESLDTKEQYIKQILANMGLNDIIPKLDSFITFLAQGLTDDQGAKDISLILGGYNTENPEINYLTMTSGIHNAASMLDNKPDSELSDLAVLDINATGEQGVVTAQVLAWGAVTGTPPQINADILKQALTQISNADTGTDSDEDLRYNLLSGVFSNLGVDVPDEKIRELSKKNPQDIINSLVATTGNQDITPDMVADITGGEIYPELSSHFQ